MLTIIRLYVFDKIEHTPEDLRSDLDRDASIIIEKIANTSVARTVKSRSTRSKNLAEHVELIDLVKASGDYEEIIECQTYDFVSV